jgi:hypothetical protein
VQLNTSSTQPPAIRTHPCFGQRRFDDPACPDSPISRETTTEILEQRVATQSAAEAGNSTSPLPLDPRRTTLARCPRAMSPTLPDRTSNRSACNRTHNLTAAAHLRREPTADLETLLLSYLLTPANDEVPNPDAPDAASGAAVLLGCADRGCGASLDIPPPPARPRPE